MKRIVLAVLMLFTLSSNAQLSNQTKLLNWLNTNAVSLKDDYVSLLAKDLDSVKVLGLAEASHGTKEFYQEKVKIIRYLIANEGYREIGFEYLDTDLARINGYVSGQKGDLKTLMKNLGLYNTEEFYTLFEWIKVHNHTNPTQLVSVFGFHQEDFYDPFTRDSLMANLVLERQERLKQKIIIWGHNLHLARYDAKTVGANAMGKHLANKLSSKYFNIGFDTYEGGVSTLVFKTDGSFLFEKHQLEKPMNNFSEIFSKSNKADFYVKFAKNNPFAEIESTITNIWADWRKPFAIPVKLGLDYDALIFIRNTSASEPLD
ncbi:erythromycin esterase family protein [Pedobacter sp.]